MDDLDIGIIGTEVGCIELRNNIFSKESHLLKGSWYTWEACCLWEGDNYPLQPCHYQTEGRTEE